MSWLHRANPRAVLGNAGEKLSLWWWWWWASSTHIFQRSNFIRTLRLGYEACYQNYHKRFAVTTLLLLISTPTPRYPVRYTLRLSYLNLQIWTSNQNFQPSATLSGFVYKKMSISRVGNLLPARDCSINFFHFVCPMWSFHCEKFLEFLPLPQPC